jgi:glycosyltransferase involved in cell wall biosynthesis
MTFFLYPKMHTLPKRLIFPLAIRQSARLADAIIAVSESTRQDTIRLLGVPEDKIIAIPNGVGSEFQVISNANLLSEVRSKYHLPDEFILYVGQIQPRKNLPTLLRSYKKLVTMGEKIPLVIVGSFGWMYKNVLREIDVLGLEKLVHFTGYTPTEDLSIIYNLARVFVYVSIYEGFGLPPLEAMACGTPVITSAVSSMPEHVGDAGILIPPDDEDALAQAMHLLLNDQALREHLSEKGRIQAAQFTWERAAQETLRVYQRVLEVS